MLFKRILVGMALLVIILVSYACLDYKSIVTPIIIAVVVFPLTYFITKYGHKNKRTNLAIKIFSIACICVSIAYIIWPYISVVF